MQVFRFIGDPNYAFDDPAANNSRSIVLQGVEFPIGEAVQVDDAALITKLSGNSHFETVIMVLSAEDIPTEETPLCFPAEVPHETAEKPTRGKRPRQKRTGSK